MEDRREPLPDLFQDFIKDHTDRDGSDIAQRLNDLFMVLNTAPAAAAACSRRTGHASRTSTAGSSRRRSNCPPSTRTSAPPILDACAVDWSTISPAIFGSMFQSVRDAQTRRELGEHYTSEENILKTLNPLFLDELRAEFEQRSDADSAEADQRAQRAMGAARRHPLHGPRLWLRQLHHRCLPGAA